MYDKIRAYGLDSRAVMGSGAGTIILYYQLYKLPEQIGVLEHPSNPLAMLATVACINMDSHCSSYQCLLRLQEVAV